MADAPPLRTETLSITGMTCDHCTRAVREALEAVDGATVRSVDVGQAHVDVNPEQATRDELVDAIQEAGYAVED